MEKKRQRRFQYIEDPQRPNNGKRIGMAKQDGVRTGKIENRLMLFPNRAGER